MTPIERLLGAHREEYSCLAVSTAHIREEDAKELQRLADAPPNVCDMITARESGFFVKLFADEYDDQRLNYYPGLSHEANALLELACRAGYLMVELDCDARRYPGLPEFSW